MAMTLRLPEEDDRILTERAEREGKSKQELAIAAIRRDNERSEQNFEEALGYILDRDAEILDALK